MGIMQISLIIIMWVATALTLTGMALNAKKKVVCWPMMLVGNILWLYFNLQMGLWGPLTLVVPLVGMNIYGWIEWRKGK